MRPDYEGDIAIKGLVEDAQVKITDISGRLVYETTALGGQAIWNGKTYEGKRVQTGVYLVLATNTDGSEAAVAKIFMIH
ncbi:MAG: T9SS type A sorting domain-containing protein [Sphingobacteriales bacterium]|nr:T9SS type A sorting domain-containing protein [Sphingobacteriales bacterium]